MGLASTQPGLAGEGSVNSQESHKRSEEEEEVKRKPPLLLQVPPSNTSPGRLCKAQSPEPPALSHIKLTMQSGDRELRSYRFCACLVWPQSEARAVHFIYRKTRELSFLSTDVCSGMMGSISR